jgi:hypothetical protein
MTPPVDSHIYHQNSDRKTSRISVTVFVADWKVIVTTQEKIEAFLFSY